MPNVICFLIHRDFQSDVSPLFWLHWICFNVIIDSFLSVECFQIAFFVIFAHAMDFPWQAEIAEKSDPYCCFVDFQTHHFLKLSA